MKFLKPKPSPFGWSAFSTSWLEGRLGETGGILGETGCSTVYRWRPLHSAQWHSGRHSAQWQTVQGGDAKQPPVEGGRPACAHTRCSFSTSFSTISLFYKVTIIQALLPPKPFSADLSFLTEFCSPSSLAAVCGYYLKIGEKANC